MPSPTEPISAETLILPLKDVMEPSQESVSNVNPDGNEVINFDDNTVNQEQPQQPQQQQQQQQGTTSTTTVETSPSHMIDATIVNDGANATSAASIISPNDANLTTTATTITTIDTTQDATQDMTKSSVNGPKRKYTRRTPKEDPGPRRRTRNTTKAAAMTAMSTPQDEQSTTPRRTPSIASTSSSQVTTSRRGTTASNVDLNSPIEFTGSTGRQLPSKEGINQTNIADRFVDFIMYCNPTAPESLDKVALVRSFNAVPKSDGKVFQTWSLYQLVGKHYAGEIRTWTKLAQKLGVVRTPEASPQKIQQYAVRLKKWMASVHVDAYFDYMLSRPNEYYQLPQKNPTEASDDESDVVLKLIKRAGSKRQKRKYTRKNTNTSTNDDGASHPEGVSSTELDDETHFESEDVDDGTDKHRDKRARPSYSDDNEGSEDDRDPWSEMEVDEEEEEEESERPTEQTGSNQRRKSVQVGFDLSWVKDNVRKEENENIVGGRLEVRKEDNPENDSSRYYRQYPSQFASNLVSLPHLIEPKNGSNIPTPNPSPTTMPDMSLSSGIVTGNKRVLSHSGATGGAGTQKLRWRISTGPTHAVRSSADESYLTTSPSSSQKEPKKKQDAGQVREPREPRQPPMARPPRNVANVSNVSNDQQIADGRNFAEMLLPSTLPNNDKDTISMLQKKLVSAVGMLEDYQRKNNMLNNLVRQRDEDVRQRVIRAIKDEVNVVLERFQ